MPPTDYTTFRVRGIPARTTRKGLQALISEAVSCQDASGVRVRSLAVDALRPREMVATITFADIPEELSDAGGNWTVDAPPDITLTIDTHFHGCTTLYCPPADEWKSDLIAISGLNGHAFGSFKKKKSSYMWLRDSLPRDFPDCRIIIYGYDTKLQDSRSFQSLLDIGKKFQTAVRQVRQNARKPLILLGHSLGGIVAKEAIKLMRESSIDADKLTFKAIRGIIFFGVPNQGMDIRSLIPMVGDQANRGFLHTLDHSSPVLRTQARDFAAAVGDIRCKILNFYETQESPTAHQNEDGTWSMSGPPAVLVDTHSATHGRPDDFQGHRVYPIDCDHSNLIKFVSEYDDPYVAVTAFLQELDSYQASPKAPMTDTEEACYQSLGFREQYHRMDSLEPSPGTCNWLKTHELFTEWLESSKGFLWIRGKPGSGKSMAMKHALRHIKLSTSGIVASFFIHAQGAELQRSILGIYRSLLHQIYPYSPESFSSLTTRFEEYEREAGAGKDDVKWSWMQGEIRQDFFQGLQKLCKKERVIILVDALDEAGEEQARVMFKDLDTLVDSLGDNYASHLSLCVACRHYPDIGFKTGKTIVMENLNRSDIEYVVNTRLNSDAVFDFSEKQLLKTEILGKSEGIFQWTSLVTETVIRMRQRGDSFKAAMRNIDRVPRGLYRLYKALLEPQNEQEHELEQRTKLFRWVALATEPLTPRMLQHILAFNSKTTYGYVCEYEQSDAFIAEHDFETKIKNLSHGLLQINGPFEFGQIEFIHQSILDFLLEQGGLALLSGSPNSDPIAFGHHELSMTCLKYLLVEEIHHFNPNSASNGYHDWLQPTEPWMRRFPVFSYAWCNWILHAVHGKALKNGEDEDSCGIEIMKTFRWPEDQPIIERWVSVKHTFGSPLNAWVESFLNPMFDNKMRYEAELPTPERAEIPEWPCKNARLIHLLAMVGLFGQHAQREMFSDLESLAISSKFSVTPLGYALLGRQKKIVENMIEAGARVQYNAKPSGPSPLYLASLWGDPAVVSLLLKSGSKVGHQESNSWTPLHIAARMGNVGAIKILIHAGADVNARSAYPAGSRLMPPNRGQSPLHLAAWSGKMEAVRQLIDLGANIHARDKFGNTAVHAAADTRSSTKMLILLLSRGADVNAVNCNGRSPLGCVLQSRPRPGRRESLQVIRLLLRAGLVPKLMRNEMHAAIPEMSMVQVLRLLLKAGMDPNTRDDEGETALFWVVRSRNSSVRSGRLVKRHTERQKIDGVELLLQSGADPSITNQIGRTALSYAMRNGDSRVAWILRESGCPESVWRRHSRFSFPTKGFVELTGRLTHAFKRAGSWYSDSAKKVARLLCCRMSVVYDIIENSSSSSDVVSSAYEGLSYDESLDDGWLDDGWLDDGWSY